MLPCAHEIAKRLNDGTWHQYQFDPYWRVVEEAEMLRIQANCRAYDTAAEHNARERLDHSNLSPVILDPVVRPGRRLAYRGERMARRLNSTDNNSTRRDLTAAEVAVLETAERTGQVSIIEHVETLASQADANAARERARVQAEQKRRRKPRRCRKCNMTGHDRRNCPRLQGERRPTQPDVVVEVMDDEESGLESLDYEELIDLTGRQ